MPHVPAKEIPVPEFSNLMKSIIEKSLNKINMVEDESGIELGDKNHRYLHFQIEPKSESKGILDVPTSIKLSIKTRNELKNMLNPNESYEDLIVRLIEINKKYKLEFKTLKNNNELKKDLIDYSERISRRVSKTFVYHPDVKIEYSYNDVRSLIDNYSLDLTIENYIYKGELVEEIKGLKLMLTINIIKELSNINLEITKDILKQKEKMIDDSFELIKMKYLIYFKILYDLLNTRKKSRRFKDENLLSEDFWKSIYLLYDLPDNSLERDVMRKLSLFRSELKQNNLDFEKRFGVNL